MRFSELARAGTAMVFAGTPHCCCKALAGSPGARI
jgi:hypothetical protein